MTASPLVQSYLADLRSVAIDRLGPARSDELVADIAEHIDAAVATGQPAEAVLERLGSPVEIVTAEAPDLIRTPTGPRLRVQEIAAISLLLIGFFIVLVGWIVGVVLLWASDRWTTRSKLAGTLLWPGGLGAAVWLGTVPGAMTVTTESCDGAGACQTVVETSGPPAWVGISLLVVTVLVPIVTAVHLARSARNPAVS